jgi:hypothetical protein
VQSDLILNAKGWRQLSLLNGWVHLGGDYQNLSAKKNGNIISVQGLINCTTTVTSGMLITVIPSGMRPKNRLVYMVQDLAQNNIFRIDFLLSGDVLVYFYIYNGGSPTLSINISFSL